MAEALFPTLLRHENILNVYGIITHRSQVFILEEFCEGVPLSEFFENNHGLEDDDLRIKNIRMVFWRLLSALCTYLIVIIISYLLIFQNTNNFVFLKTALMIRYSICHRDLKCENILINLETLQPKIIDFELAALFSYNAQQNHEDRK